MSLALLAQGVLVKDPESRQSAKGKSYATGLLRVAVDGEDAILVSLVAFSETAAQALLGLRKGDQAAVTGSAKPTSWTGREGTNHGLSIIVERVMTLYEVRQRKKEADISSANS